MIVVDTSVWVSAFREPSGEDARILKTLIDADEVCLALPVRVELAAGLGAVDRARLRRGLRALPVAAPTDATWTLIERWSDRAADAGQRFTLVDLLIAALAHELTGLVWSLDRDFDRMAALGFVQSYR
jgi:predicted nucleic acid-binding protein